jgi:hypothetical protein
MKLHRIPILRIIFLFAVLTCTGITVYTYSQNRDFSLELSAGSNNVENRFSSEVNASDDDQIYHTYNTALIEGFGSEIQVPRNRSFILQFSFSVWQPPKIS